MTDEDQYYLQDSRSYLGNDVLWWALEGNGYTTDLSKAQVYSKEEALRLHQNRPSDIPWPKRYVDAKVRPAVDMQYLNREEALAGTGITLQPRRPPRTRQPQARCLGCGRLMSQAQYWGGACSHCSTDNRP